MHKSRIYIIGVAPEGAASLSQAALRLARQAEIVLGGERLLKVFPALTGEKVIIKKNLTAVTRRITANLGLKRMVVLASGDPDFFGIARYLTEKLGKQKVEIIPNVSSMQVAFARIKESWDDAALVSVHSRPVEDIIETIRPYRKIGILTDDRNTPAKIAGLLLEHGFENCRAYVCQDLGSDKERIVSANLSRLKSMEFSPLCIMILIRGDNLKEDRQKQLLGIPEEKFFQKGSQITKSEVRAISLAKLGLNEYSTVWDIGAGSGAVSIEASLLTRRGHIFCIEKDGNSIANIKKNIKKFRRPNITVIQASAPDKLPELPDPTAVFIGGSSGKMDALLGYVCRRLKPGGRVVCNVTTLENMHHAISSLQTNGFEAEITMVNIARSKDIAGLTRLEPLNPVFIVSGSSKGESVENEPGE